MTPRFDSIAGCTLLLCLSRPVAGCSILRTRPYVSSILLKPFLMTSLELCAGADFRVEINVHILLWIITALGTKAYLRIRRNFGFRELVLLLHLLSQNLILCTNPTLWLNLLPFSFDFGQPFVQYWEVWDFCFSRPVQKQSKAYSANLYWKTELPVYCLASSGPAMVVSLSLEWLSRAIRDTNPHTKTKTAAYGYLPGYRW